MANETELRAVIRLVDEMTPQLNAMKANLRSMSRSFSESFDKIKELGAGIGALAVAGGGVWYATSAAADSAVELDMLSQQTGVAVERMQAWQAVAVASGQDAGEFAEALRDMNIELSDAATGNKESLANLLSQVGISARDSTGRIRDANDVFLEFADAVARQTDPMIQYRMAIEAFGEDTGVKLLPILRKGSEAFKRSEEAMKAAGSAITSDQIDDLKEFRNQWNLAKQSMESLTTSVLSSLAPSFTILSEELQAVMNAIRPVLNSQIEAWSTRLSESLRSIDWASVANWLEAFCEGGRRARERLGLLGQVFSFAFHNIGEIIALALGYKTIGFVMNLYAAFTSLGSSVLALGRVAGTLMSFVTSGKLVATVIAGINAAVTSFGATMAVMGRAGLMLLNFAKMATPLGLLVTAITAVFFAVKDKFGPIGEIFEGVCETIRSAIDPLLNWFASLKDGVVDTFSSVTDTISGAWNSISSILPSFGSDDEETSSKLPMLAKPESVANEDAFYPTKVNKAAIANEFTKTSSVSSSFFGEVRVIFEGAPQELKVKSTRGSQNIDVSATIEYDVGSNPYAPAW